VYLYQCITVRINMEHNLVSLTGLPKELGSMIASHLPPKAIGSMQRTSKRTQQISLAAMKKLCETLPNEDELRDYTQYLKEVYSERSVSRYRPDIVQVARKHPKHAGISYSLRDEDGWKQIHKEDEAFKFMGIPDPNSVLGILRRRVGCRREYLVKHKVDAYGLNIVRTYLRGVLRPFLLPIVGEYEDEVFNPLNIRADIERLVQPIPTSESEVEALRMRKKYQNNLLLLKLLVWTWLGEVNWALALHQIDNVEDITIDAETLIREARELIIQVHNYSNRLVYIMKRFDDEKVNSVPDHPQIVRWIREMLSKKRMRLRVAFLGDDYSVTILQALNGNVQITPSGIGLEEVLSNLPGRVDPNTLLSVMREHQDNKHRIAMVRSYIRVVLKDVDYYTLLSGNTNREIATPDDEQLYSPEEAIQQHRVGTIGDYSRIVSRLRSLATWMETGTYDQRTKWLTTDKINNTNTNILRRQAHQVIRILVRFIEELSDVAEEEDEEEDVDEE